MLELYVVRGPRGSGRSFALPVGRSLTLGREKSCDIALSSSGVSKRHARLTVLSNSKAEIEDLGSSNGTYVNGLLVKKHVLKPGDSITLNDFLLQLRMAAPAIESIASVQVPLDSSSPVPEAIAVNVQTENATSRVQQIFEKHLFPVADSLSEKFDVRLLVGGFFLLWSMLLALLAIVPTVDKANQKMREKSAEIASLYARQLARINQQAVQELRYRDLIVQLDSRVGDTDGLMNAMIIDAVNNQILAPVEQMGQALPNKEAVVAVTKDLPHVQYRPDGVAYISVPIKVGSSEGNKTVAASFVEFDTSRGALSFAALLDQVLTSLIIALVLSLLFIVFVYRWTEGSIETLGTKIDEAMKRGDTNVPLNTQWPSLKHVGELVSGLLGRVSSNNGGGMQAAGGGEWAVAAANQSFEAAAAFDSALSVSAWNLKMERLIGIRASMAIGADISAASRDVAFESAVKELAAQCIQSPWVKSEKILEFSGRNHKIIMVYGNSAYLVNIAEVEE